jgi:superfamily II DNA/RNA helicase
MPFRPLNLSPQILRTVQDAGYTEPTPIQVAAIPHILAGHDLIGIAQTGTGKTAAFVFPILTMLAAAMQNGQRRGTRALVVAPTRVSWWCRSRKTCALTRNIFRRARRRWRNCHRLDVDLAICHAAVRAKSISLY